MTSQIVRLCGGRERCSLLADPVTINIMSGEEEVEQEVNSCHANLSVLRTTAACIDVSALHIQTDQTETGLANIGPTTTILRPKKENPTMPGKILSVDNESQESLERKERQESKESQESQESQERQKSQGDQESQGGQESAVAKPLEPKPTTVLLFSSDISTEESEDLTNILIVITTSLTVALTILLVSILYKLYQTYQTPPASPLPAPLNQYSQYSINTQLTELTELTEIHDDSERLTGSGTWPSKASSRQYRVTFDLTPEYLSIPPLMEDNQSRDYFLKEEATDKWQFPRVCGNRIEKKYLSL